MNLFVRIGAFGEATMNKAVFLVVAALLVF